MFIAVLYASFQINVPPLCDEHQTPVGKPLLSHSWRTFEVVIRRVFDAPGSPNKPRANEQQKNREGLVRKACMYEAIGREQGACADEQRAEAVKNEGLHVRLSDGASDQQSRLGGHADDVFGPVMVSMCRRTWVTVSNLWTLSLRLCNSGLPSPHLSSPKLPLDGELATLAVLHAEALCAVFGREGSHGRFGSYNGAGLAAVHPHMQISQHAILYSKGRSAGQTTKELADPAPMGRRTSPA